MQTIFVSGANKSREQWVSIQWLRFVFRVKLAANKPRMDVAREFDHLDKLPIGRDAAEHQSFFFQTLPELRIELITMAVTFADLICAAINVLDEGARR